MTGGSIVTSNGNHGGTRIHDWWPAGKARLAYPKFHRTHPSGMLNAPRIPTDGAELKPFGGASIPAWYGGFFRSHRTASALRSAKRLTLNLSCHQPHTRSCCTPAAHMKAIAMHSSSESAAVRSNSRRLTISEPPHNL
jgi:hypothetical protein